MKFLISFFLFFFLTSKLFPQIENIPADHPVYPFLKQMYVKGILKQYDDVFLPLSKEIVINALKKIDSSRYNLSTAERDFLDRMKMKIFIEEKSQDLFDKFPGSFFNNISMDSQKHLYHFNDSLINLYIDPLADYKFIYSKSYEASSSLLNYGGKFRGSYDNWLGFNLQGTIGLQFNNREVARLDKRVAQSFTFNDTELNYFDDTEGYIRLKKGIASVQLGRERLLWGTGYIDRMILSNNPPDFDFLKFDIKYKIFSYNFIHGWLVQKPFIVSEDSLVGAIKNKGSKYIAVSRLGVNPLNEIKLGISQVIIYANRPFEAAYLNPFLFWESAQRSLNDLDNAYLSFDGRFKIADGFEASGSVIFDDINLETWSKGEWSRINNRLAWQINGMFTNPVLPENLTMILEYQQIRPYTFSHFGIGDALNYTNNGFLLGSDLQPNSTRFSVNAAYRFSGKMNFNIIYKYSLHGRNYYDEDGTLIRSVGGDINRPPHSTDNRIAPLLDGVLEETNSIMFSFNYEFIYGFYLNLAYQYKNQKVENSSADLSVIWGSFRLNFE